MNILDQIHRWIGLRRRHITVWEPVNIYPGARIGNNVSIGMFTEIGDVEVGDGVRIGAMCFIPTGVTLERQVWIGPRCTFTNDRYPPSPRARWEATRVCRAAALGAGVTVLPGVTIGEGALVGAGSVVTCDIPKWEVWAGNPAVNIKHKFHKEVDR